MLIAIEGIDGSGKGTQAAALADRLRREGRTVSLIRFPQYENTFFGREVGHYLNGDFGELENIPAKFSALLYALDRFQALDNIKSAVSNDEDIIFDRYTGSNVAHQSARVPESERLSMMSWIRQVEEDILKIPAPNLVLFLDVEVKQSQHLVAQKGQRVYTEKIHDLHEASVDHLQLALENFRFLAKERGWVRLFCADKTGNLKSPREISDEIYAEVLRARNSV